MLLFIWMMMIIIHQRISHAVETLAKNPDYLIAGCDELPIYFNEPENLLQSRSLF